MSTKDTEVHSITIPVDGYEQSDPSYADLLETAIDELEQNVRLVGVASNLPNTGAVPTGVRYEATDQNLLYRNTSDGWLVTGHGTSGDPVPEAHFADASVQNAPSSSTDVARKNELDGKADTDANVENFGTQGAQGTMPMSQGDGTLSMSSPSDLNVPNWKVDANSPFDVSGVSEFDYTIAKNNYDYAMCSFEITCTSTFDVSRWLSLRFEGEESNYTYWRMNAGAESDSVIRLAGGVENGVTVRGSFVLTSNSAYPYMSVNNLIIGPNMDRLTIGGYTTDVTSPVSNFQMLIRDYDSLSATGNVYVR